MEQETDQEREEVLEALRETARENRESLKNRYGQAGECFREDFREEKEGGKERTGRSFYLRTVLSLLIFLGLLFLKRENRTVFGLSPENLQETLSSGVLLLETTEDNRK